MKRILLIGHAPEIHKKSTCVSFSQLRTWSIHRFLLRSGYEVETVLVPNNIEDSPIVVPNKNIEAVVTAGPFSSAYAALSLPKDIPLWLDWPSDPRADLHARIHENGEMPSPSEQAFVSLLHTLALQRADAVGVISHRQYWATLSTLMDWRIQDETLPYNIHVTPIAFDFPFAQRKDIPTRTDLKNIALCGSLNSWFDSKKARFMLEGLITKNKDIHVHVFGGYVKHSVNHQAIQNWKHPRVHIHGWLPNDEFHKKLSTMQVGFWINRTGIEPLLGSRTRALLFAWMGMDIAASCDTELMVGLKRKGLVWDVRTPEDLSKIIHSPAFPKDELRTYCHQHFSPDLSYAPLLQWLKNPSQKSNINVDALSEEVQALRKKLENIHNSPTWKMGNRLHRIIRNWTPTKNPK